MTYGRWVHRPPDRDGGSDRLFFLRPDGDEFSLFDIARRETPDDVYEEAFFAMCALVDAAADPSGEPTR